MPVKELQNFRAKYPQYDDMDDYQLATRLAEKYPDAYKDLPGLVEESDINGFKEKDLATKFIPQFTKGLYENVPYGKATMSHLPNAEQVQSMQQQIPQPRGFKAKAGRFIGDVASDVAMSIPFFGAAGAIPKVGMIPKAAVGAAGYEATKDIVQGKPEEALPDAVSTAAGTMAFGYAGKFAAKGAVNTVKGIKNLPSKAEEFGEKLVNSMISPKNKEMLFGNPGRAIVKEGIIAETPKELGIAVSTKLKELNPMLNEIYQTNNNVIRNYKSYQQPLKEAMSKLKSAPQTNRAAINRLQKALDDIENFSQGYYKTPTEARKLKQFIAELADFTYEGKANSTINNALKKSYGSIDKILDEALPQSRHLNQRITDLISADSSVKTYIAKQAKKDPLPRHISDVLNTPFNVLSSPGFRTKTASMLSSKYKPLPKMGTIEQPIINPVAPTNLLPNPTKALPAPRDVPYNPTGFRNAGEPPIKMGTDLPNQGPIMGENPVKKISDQTIRLGNKLKNEKGMISSGNENLKKNYHIAKIDDGYAISGKKKAVEAEFFPVPDEKGAIYLDYVESHSKGAGLELVQALQGKYKKIYLNAKSEKGAEMAKKAGFKMVEPPNKDPNVFDFNQFGKFEWTRPKGAKGNMLGMMTATSAGVGTALVATKASANTLGVRNNNPVNIKVFDKKDPWEGTKDYDKQGHVIFETVDHGIRAALKNAYNRQKSRPNQTLKSWLNQFAEENGTNEAKYISSKMDITPTTQLKDIDMDELIIHLAFFESKMKLSDKDIQRVKTKFKLK